jgi:RNA polymerase sigma-B factor
MVASSTLDSSPTTAVDGAQRAQRTASIVADLRREAPGSLRSRALTHSLIEANSCVARSMAARYRNRGIDLDDLEQVALLGLTKAAQRFDPDAGHEFLSYAVPTIRGEIRKHFRDAGWTVRPPRRVQELQARIRPAQDELERQMGRTPRPSELAAHLDEDVTSVVEALTADGCFTPTSLNGPSDDPRAEGSPTTLGELLPAEDRATESAEARIILVPVVRRLCERDQRILQMRFVEDRTQLEIADALGLTQSHVSRIPVRILSQLRSSLTGSPTAA